MAEVIGVRFKNMGKVYYFDPNSEKLSADDHVVVETARGVECGEVAMANRDVADDSIVQPLKKVIRKATKDDLRRVAENELKAERDTLKVIYDDVPDSAFVVEKENVSKTIQKVFKVEGKGYIFKMKVTGYKDGTSFLVALDKDGKVVDYVAISNGDTQGLGSKVTEKPFREKLQGADALGSEIDEDTITGATVSSKPVIEGIKEAAKYQADHLK